MTRPNAVRAHADRGSIPLALLVVISLAGIMGALVMTTIASSRSARFDHQYAEVIQSADAGAQAGVQHLLRGTPPQQLATMAGPVSGAGNLDGTAYTWEATRVDQVTWRVTSTATHSASDVTRTVVIDVIGQKRPSYGVFVDVGWRFAGNTRLGSYGGTGAPNILATNGYINIKGSTSIGVIHLYNWLSDPNGSRCQSNSPGACPAAATFDGRLTVGPGETMDTQELVNQRTAPPCTTTTPLPSYNASSYDGGSGTLGTPGTPTTLCVADAVFDRNVQVLGPVKMYVYGNLTFGAHVHVNCGTGPCPNESELSTSPPDAGQLEIMVSGTRDDGSATQVEARHHSRVAAVVFAPQSMCRGGAQAHHYGSLACREVRTVGGYRFFYDERLPELSASNFDMRRWSEQ